MGIVGSNCFMCRKIKRIVVRRVASTSISQLDGAMYLMTCDAIT